MSWVIHTNALTKQFPPLRRGFGLLPSAQPGQVAVDAVDLTVKEGELFGLVGPNGAGKTTLIKMLSTLIVPSSGTAKINGYDLHQEVAIKSSIGLASSDERSFYWRLSARQNLEFFATLYGLPASRIERRVGEVLAQVDLTSVADARFNTYSTGMRQRLSIARALLNEPRLIFMDEPTRSLDPVSLCQLHELIREQLVNKQGITILLTTHQLAEVEQLCDRIAIMHKGTLKACGSMSELRHQLDLDTISLEKIFMRLTEQTETELTQSQPALTISPATLSVSTGVKSKPEPVSSVSSWRVFLAFLKRDWHSEVSYRLAFFLQFFNIFFSIAVFYFLAKFLGQAASSQLVAYGGNYFAFVLIGIAFAEYFGVGLSGFSNSLRLAQTTGTLEAMLTSPATVSVIILGSTLWSYLLTTFRVIIYLLVGGLFLDVDFGQGNYPLAFLILLLTIISVSSMGIISASFIMVLKRGDPVSRFMNMFSRLLGGVYYPPTVLPGWLQIFSWLLPVTYSLQAMRLALLQGATFATLWPDILALSLFSLFLLPLSLLSFRYAVRRAKVDGSLSHY